MKAWGMVAITKTISLAESPGITTALPRSIPSTPIFATREGLVITRYLTAVSTGTFDLSYRSVATAPGARQVTLTPQGTSSSRREAAKLRR